MAYAPKSARSQAVETLAEKLDRLDILLGKLDSRTSSKAFEILKLMDEIHDTLITRARDGISITAEQAQFDSACATLRKNGRALVQAAGGRKSLIAQRASVNPTSESWWWRLDELVAEQNKNRAIRTLGLAALILLLTAAVILIYNRFLAPSPESVARYQAEQRVMELAHKGKYEQALAEVENGLRAVPQDRDLLLLKGVVLQALGSNQSAETIFVEIQNRYPNLPEFLLTKSQSYIMIGNPERAAAEAQKALAVNPDLAEAYLLLGGAQEMQEKIDEALVNYNKAAQLASKQGDTNTEITAKVRAATLMQRAPAGLYPGTR